MIHLIVGNTGSGKTTYANTLKEEVSGIVFTIDTWNKTLFLKDKKDSDGIDWFLERIERSESIMQDLILQLEKRNVDSILDLGLSKYSHREKFRNFAKQHSIKTNLHFLDIPKEIRKERVLYRNKNKGTTFEFEVSEADFDFMETWFEIPTELEMLQSIHIKN